MFRFAQHDSAIVWIGLDVRELGTRQAAKCFEIFRGSLFDNILWQAWGRRVLVPVERLQIVAHELFVETGWALTDNVLVLWPEARRVRREAFVDQEQISIDSAEFKFRIRDDDSLADRRNRGRANKFPGLASFTRSASSSPRIWAHRFMSMFSS